MILSAGTSFINIDVDGHICGGHMHTSRSQCDDDHRKQISNLMLYVNASNRFDIRSTKNYVLTSCKGDYI